MCTRVELNNDAFSDIMITSFESRLPKKHLSFQASETISLPSHFSLIAHVCQFLNELDKLRLVASRFLSSIEVQKISVCR
jgi:hypothetical protein